MAQSGNWIPNLINWIIGYIVFYIWNIFASLFGFFGLWQVPLDAEIGIYESFGPMEVTDSEIYASTMSVGGN